MNPVTPPDYTETINQPTTTEVATMEHLFDNYEDFEFDPDSEFDDSAYLPDPDDEYGYDERLDFDRVGTLSDWDADYDPDNRPTVVAY